MPGADPGIPDRCVYLSPGAPHFWLSDDIQLNPPGSHGPGTPGQASLGNNTVNVIIRKKIECSAAGAVLVDVFVCNPSVGVVPPGLIANASKKITNVDPTNPDSFIPNGNTIPVTGTTFSINWNITQPNPSKPDGPGHRCLVARCYPFTASSPDSGDFHVQTGPNQGDQHVVQKNVDILASTKVQMAVPFNAANFDGKEKRTVVVRTEYDARPDERSWKVLYPMLKPTGFQRIAKNPPRSFRTTAPSIQGVEFRDSTRRGWWSAILGGLLGRESGKAFEMDLPLEPAQLTQCVLEADLSDSKPGDAHVFQLTQREVNGELLQGGLTVVLVRL
jgi:hypothetical protein